MNFDFLDFTKKYGKASCVLLYAWFARLAVKKKPFPLLILLGLHTYEYFSKGKAIAEANGIEKYSGLANCLAFGFTWWLPIQKNMY